MKIDDQSSLGKKRHSKEILFADNYFFCYVFIVNELKLQPTCICSGQDIYANVNSTFSKMSPIYLEEMTQNHKKHVGFFLLGFSFCGLKSITLSFSLFTFAK